MVKKPDEKGFTLIEILVVIVIVAILVSVVIPMFSQSTIKSRAAANAANLRSIEGQVAMELLQNPENFEDFLKDGQTITELSEGFLGTVWDWFFGEGSAAEEAYKYSFLEDIGTREIEIPNSGGRMIPNVALAKGLQAPHRDGGIGLLVDEGTLMRVHITEEGAIAAYGGYTKEDFADVAEDGIYDGAVVNSDDDEDTWWDDHVKEPLLEATCRATGKHTKTVRCICPYCEGEAHWRADKTEIPLLGVYYVSSTQYHTCVCGHDFQNDHNYSSTDHSCTKKLGDDSKCPDKTECVDIDPDDNGFMGWGADTADHTCYICNQFMPGMCQDVNTNRNGYKDHKCDTCNRTIEGSVCDVSGGYDDNNHKCSICGQTSPHSYENGKCACGRPSHVSPNDCVDSNKDHICDLGCGYEKCGGEHQKTQNLGNGTHGCKYCGKDAVACEDDPSVSGHKCKTCNTDLPSAKINHTRASNSHKCSQCSYTFEGCDYDFFNQDKHKCGICKAEKDHNWDNIVNDKENSQHKCSGCDTTQYCKDFKNSRDKCTECGIDVCITPDTLITLADGSLKRVDELTGTEELLVWDHNTGKFSTAPVAFIIDHNGAVNEVEITSLVFSDGNIVKMIGEHVFFDGELGKYVAITSENAESFIGHTFAAMTDTNEKLHMAELIAVEKTLEESAIYEIATYRTLTCFTNNVLSGCAYMDGLLNIFDVDVETMAYDAEARAADLEKYGTIEYAFFAPFVSREIFDLYNGEYMSVAMGKGVLSLGEILDLIDLHYLYIGE